MMAGYDNACAPAREPEVVLAMGALQGSISCAADAVAMLEKRTAAITRPETEAKDSDGPRLAACSLARSIYDSSSHVDALTFRLRDLLDRLEI